MAQRKQRDWDLLDGLTAELGGPRTSQLLTRLDAVVPWTRIAEPVLALPEYQAGPGRPAWPAVMMLKCLMLAKWFGLSDPQLEETRQDRLSFRRFVGLSLTDATPDETTFVVFRRRLREAGLHEVIFAAVVEHLEEQSVLVKDGTLVDATIIEAPTGRSRPDGSTTRDEEASFTRKHGRSYHGYKGHIASDRSGIVTDWRFTTGKEHDGRSLDEMTRHETTMVVADAMYDSRARREGLRARGVVDAIAYQRRRWKTKKGLTVEQERWNHWVKRIRAVGEHPFAMLKQQLGYRRVRYRGLARNAFDFCLTVTAANLKRSLHLLGA